MNAVAEKNETSLNHSFQLLSQLRSSVSNDEGHSLLDELEEKLREMEQTNQKFVEEIDYRKEDEKSFMEGQEAQRKVQESLARDQQ